MDQDTFNHRTAADSSDRVQPIPGYGSILFIDAGENIRIELYDLKGRIVHDRSYWFSRELAETDFESLKKDPSCYLTRKESGVVESASL